MALSSSPLSLQGGQDDAEEAAASAARELKADIMAHNVNVTFTRCVARFDCRPS